MSGLEFTTVSLNLANGLDQKANEFVQDAHTFVDIKDAYWSKDGEVNKRYGTTQLPTNVLSNYPSPFAIGATDIANYCFSYRNQLLLQNKGALYSWASDQEVWNQIGYHYPVEAKTDPIVSNGGFQSYQNVGRIPGVTVYGYIYTNAIGQSEVHYTVQDETTGSYIAFDQPIPQTLVTTGTIAHVKVLAFSATIFIIWQQGSDLGISKINTATGSSTTPVSLKADLVNAGGVPVPLKGIDWTYTNQAGVGERAIVCYLNTTGSQIEIFAIKNDGTVDATMGSALVATTGGTVTPTGFAVYYSPVNHKIYVGWGETFNASFAVVFWTGFATFTSSSIAFSGTQHIQFTSITNNDQYVRYVAFCDDPTTSGQVLAYLDTMMAQQINATATEPSGNQFTSLNIWVETISSSNTFLGLNSVQPGIGIAGKPVIDSTRATVYLPAEYPSDQSSLLGVVFLLDMFRTKLNPENVPLPLTIAKMNSGDNISFQNQVNSLGASASTIPIHSGPCSTLDYGNGVIAFPSLGKSTQSFEFTQTINSPLTTYDYGTVYASNVVLNTVNLLPDKSASKAQLNDGVYLSGGYMGYYDGFNICEDNYFIQPELLEAIPEIANAGNADIRFGATTIQNGSGSQHGIYDISVYGGAAFVSQGGTLLVGPTNYFEFSISSTPIIRLWYKVNGTGTAPSSSGVTTIEVDINSTDTAYQVMQKTIRALSNNTTFTTNWTVTVVTPNKSRIESKSNVVTASSITGFAPTTVQSPGAGTYQYAVCLSWIDVNGRKHRSAPSNTISGAVTVIQTSDAAPIFVNFMIPPLTNRICSQVGIEIYRTSTNPGATFHRITPYPLVLTMNNASQWFSYADYFADGANLAAIEAQEELYTDGDILPNAQIAPCATVSAFRDRIVATGPESNALFYSKPAIIGEAVEFGEALFITMQEDGEEIVGHAQMDDKLVVFKDRKIVYFVGDGANELGTGSSFSSQVLISADVGCESQNSVELSPLGLFFQSKIGMALLTRGTEITYPGLNAKDYNAFTVGRSLILKDDDEVRQIRFVLSDTTTCLVFDYLKGKWTVFTNYGGQDSCLWLSQFTRVDGSGLVYFEDKAQTRADITPGPVITPYNPVLKTAWLKLKNMQDFQRVQWLLVLGQLKSANSLNFQIYYDYDPTNFDAYSFASSNISGPLPDDLVYEPSIHLKRQKGSAIQIVMTPTTDGTGTQECLVLIDMSFIVGAKRGLQKVKAGKQL